MDKELLLKDYIYTQSSLIQPVRLYGFMRWRKEKINYSGLLNSLSKLLGFYSLLKFLFCRL